MKCPLITHDVFVSFIWVCSGSLIRYVAYKFVGLGAHNPIAVAFKGSLAVLYLVFFAWLRKLTGGAYNPLMVLCYGISGSFPVFLFTVFMRIPAQVFGSIIAVWLIMLTFPEAAHPPHLNLDIQRGTLTEGFLEFMIMTVSLTLKKKDPKRSARKTWIKSILKVVLHLQGSEITGGMMNPAAAFSWMDAQGDLITKKPSSRQLVGRMDMHFVFSRGTGSYCRKRTRTLHHNGGSCLIFLHQILCSTLTCK